MTYDSLSRTKENLTESEIGNLTVAKGTAPKI
jgi:hypothetical protein